MAAIAWVPLAVLAASQGLALGDDRRESQLLDISAYVRYLIAIPTFVLAEAVCLPQLGRIAHQFLDAGLVPDDSHEWVSWGTVKILPKSEQAAVILTIEEIDG